MPSDPRIHAAAATGFQIAADLYEKGRPEYPADAVAWLVRELRITAGSTVVDLAAGTGKLTRLLLPTGCRLIAVDPVAGMRQQFAAILPQVQMLDGLAEAIPLEDRVADALVAAQAFHWFANEQALREIHRVLKPAGRFGLLWNWRDESVDWVAKLTQIIDAHVGDAPQFRHEEWRGVLASSPLFGPLHEASFRHEQRLDQPALIARIASVSYIATLEEAKRRAVLDAVRQLVATHPQTQGRVEIVMPYQTHAFWCERLG